MSVEQPTNADILQELHQLKNGQTELHISVAKIATRQKALTVGIGLAMTLTIILYNEQKAATKRIENNIANQPNTSCQCQETERR